MIHGRSIRKLVYGLAAGALLVAAACSDDDDDDDGDGGGGGGSGVLAEVQDRGELNCGVNTEVPGFGSQDENGEFTGFDIDFCKAVAAAVLDDPEAVEYVPTTPEQRFPSLQSGEIDVLIRNTTWTSTRDGGEGGAFVTTTFYDGQGMMVKTDSGIADIDGLAGHPICFTTGTTTEANLADRMSGIDYEPNASEENPEVQDKFIAGQCDGWTSDKSQLAGLRSAWPEDQGGPEALTILDETFSKEPLGPVVRDGDSEWFDIVNWVVHSTIEAEELGVSSENLEEMLESEDPAVQHLLGVPAPTEDEEGNPIEDAVLDHELGIDPEFTQRVIEAVGNYGEIYDRNVGPTTALGLEREGTENALWTEGGLLYSPPFR